MCERGKRIVCVGTLIQDMFPTRRGAGLIEQEAFIPAPGGAIGNVAVAAARMGAGASVAAKVGNDVFGRNIRNVLAAEGVNTENVILDGNARTTMNFHAVLPGGDIEYCFYRNPGADTRLRFEEISSDFLDNAAFVHFDSLAFSDEPFRSACLEIIRRCKERGIPVSLDGNFRDAIWAGDAWNRLMEEILPFFDILKLNLAELQLLYPALTLESGMSSAAEKGVRLILVTDGEKGAHASFQGKILTSGGFQVSAVDTIGCGDAFIGAFLARMAGISADFSDIQEDALLSALSVANAAAALTATKKGALTAIPQKDEVVKLSGVEF